jgi:hypothetical protein
MYTRPPNRNIKIMRSKGLQKRNGWLLISFWRGLKNLITNGAFNLKEEIRPGEKPLKVIESKKMELLIKNYDWTRS